MTVHHLEPPPDEYEPPDDPYTPPPAPSDPAAEQAVIGALLRDTPQALPDITRWIAPQDFWQPRHELIYRAAIDLHHRGDPVEVASVAAELTRRGDIARAGGPAYLQHLEERGTVSNAAYYARIVADLATARRLDELGKRLVQTAHGADPATFHDALERAHAWLTEALDETPTDQQTDPRLLSGGAFLFDHPDSVEALWGDGDDILWAAGETLLVAGPQGVGKTTIAQQLTLARIGARPPELLGLPLTPARRALYLAMDRPRQAARSLRRMVTPDQRPLLDQALTVWLGPPPGRLVEDQRVLVDLATRAGLEAGDFVVIDSVKDTAPGIASDEVGAAVNIALQHILAAGVDVLALHHNRKRGGDKQHGAVYEPDIDDVYGSTFIPSGTGSVVILSGSPGDPIVRMHHVKQPVGEVGPYQLKHFADTGTTEVFHSVDVLQAVLDTGAHGMSAKALAFMLFPKTDDVANSRNEVEKARRKLDSLVTSGHLLRRDPPEGARRGEPATYVTAFTRSGEYRG
jgi:replicative DNA helicase